MAGTFDQGFSFDTLAKATDLKKRLLFAVLALFIYRIGTYIPLPGLDPTAIASLASRHLGSGGFLGVINTFSGGALSRMTVFALNLMPYISASIIIQLFTMVSPSLEALKKEGESGRRILNQYTKYLAIGVATFQAYSLSLWLVNTEGSPVVIDTFVFQVIAVLSLVSGTMFLVWLGEQITARGIGNGSSLLIFAGIVANLPASIMNIIELGKIGAIKPFYVVVIFAAAFFMIMLVVFVERAQRKVIINYPQRQAMLARGQNMDVNHLPLKINSAGVIPPIFAYSLISLPMMVLQFVSSENEWVVDLLNALNRGGLVFSLILVVMIVFFSFFYTAVVFNPVETADNLKKAGGYIPGVRPGKSTAEYLDYILTRLTTVGAIYMSAVCIFPNFMENKFNAHFLFSGTGILIIVGVTIDTISQIYAQLLSHQYRGILNKMEKKKR